VKVVRGKERRIELLERRSGSSRARRSVRTFKPSKMDGAAARTRIRRRRGAEEDPRRPWLLNNVQPRGPRLVQKSMNDKIIRPPSVGSRKGSRVQRGYRDGHHFRTLSIEAHNTTR